MKVKFIPLLCILALLISSAALNVFADTKEESKPHDLQAELLGYMGIADNSSAALYVDVKTANIMLIDKQTGHKWTAFPENVNTADADKFSSIIGVTYTADDGIEATVQAPSRETGFEIKKIKNGIKTIFSFQSENTGFSVPITVTLKDSYIEISIVYSEVTEKGKSKITDIELLPNLMYGSNEQDGYIFIPDGSGAVINYSDSVSRKDTYSAHIYGSDPCQDIISPVITDAKKALLPVYGAVKDNSALFAVITSGDVYADINAEMAENALTVCSKYVYREHDLTGIQSSSGGERTLNIIQSAPIVVQPTVRLYMLSGDNANYSGMARTYRDFLVETKVLGNKTDGAVPAVSVMAFGAVPQKKVILGIPVTLVKKITDFNDLTALYKALTESGGEAPSFFLYGFLSGGYGAKTVIREKYISKLGGNKGYNSFKKLAGADNVYTVYNTERSYGRSFDFFRFKDYMSSLNQTVVKQHYRRPSDGQWNTDQGSWFFYSVQYQQKLLKKLLKQVPKGSGIVLEHYGEELLSDFSSDRGVTRGAYLNSITKAMENIKKSNISIALESGNACIAGVADELYGIPLESSGFSIESYSVPFYAMVFHSYIKLSSEPVNFESKTGAYALKAFEQGVSATYAVTGCDPYELKNTRLNFLYNSKTDSLLNNMTSYTADYKEIHSTLANQAISDHKYIGDLSVTEYENGWRIVCNYSDEEIVFENQNIAPLDYKIFK